jgi:integrase
LSVHKRKDGQWFVKYRENGKERRRYFGKQGETEARRYDLQLKEEKKLNERKMLTLAELADAYFRSKGNDLHRLTRKAMIYYLTDPGRDFLEKPAETLTRLDLEVLRSNLAHLKPATRNKAQTYISAILTWGVNQQLIHANPWAGVPKLKEEPLLVTATLNDFQKIMEHSAPHLAWAIEVSLYLALRPGYVELLSLKWESFNWEYGYVDVRQGKGGGIKRVIPSEAFMQRAKDRFEQDRDDNIPWVVHYKGRQIQSLRTAWKAAKRRAGYSDNKIRLYDIRHVAATEMLGRGADPAAVQHQLGHRQLSTTINTYTHVMAGAQKKAAELLPDLAGDKKGDRR